MKYPNEAERVLQDPLLPLDFYERKWSVTKKFIRLEEKRGRLKIVRLSTRVSRIRASEALRYEAARKEFPGGRSMSTPFLSTKSSISATTSSARMMLLAPSVVHLEKPGERENVRFCASFGMRVTSQLTTASAVG